MTDRPDKVEIRCEQCKQEASITALHRGKGVCSNCKNNTWHVQATYMARQDTADGTSLALNAMGLSILNGTGVAIGGPVPKKPVNGFDVHDVPGNTLAEIADPTVNPQIKLDAFIRLKRNEQFELHRKRMAELGQECIQCGMLFVRNDTKPWTLVGTCSKVCCSAKFGVSDYAMIEDKVLEQAKDLLPEVKQQQRNSQMIHVVCLDCKHEFDLPKMYGGIVRKCPKCGAKVRVPVA
jgi:DNA-directed RNA polymerase subunit RPC12/RpoP